jgi:hypothetical protein
VWGGEDGKTLLVSLFTQNAYTGEDCGMIFCWLSVGKEAMKAFEMFENEAKRRKCAFVYSSVLGGQRPEALARLYRSKGFEPYESVYKKVL